MRALLLTLTVVAACGQGLTLRDGAFLASRQATSSSPPAFTPENADFDGASFGFIAASLTGLPDSSVLTLSFWVRFDGGDGGRQTILGIYGNSGSDIRFLLFRTTGNLLSFEGYNSAGVQLVGATSNETITVADGWTYILITFDLANASNRHIYFNGVDDASVTWLPYTNGTLDLTASSPLTTLGVNAIGSLLLNGAMAEFWLDNVYLNDPTLFYDAGSPISLGTTGQDPTGSSPAVYYSRAGSGNTWVQDSSGNANNLTVTGTLTATTGPP